MRILLIICLCLITTSAYPLADSIIEELWVRRLAEKLQGDIKTVDEAVTVTRQYVYDHIKTKEGEDPYADVSVYGRLQSGVGWCNHQANIFMTLISYMGISSRMVYLMKDGVSPHTIAEVFDGKEWLIVDSTYNLDLRVNGKMATREDLRKDFTILTENPKVKELAEQYPEHWGDEAYLRMYTNDARIIKLLKGDKWKLGERRRF